MRLQLSAVTARHPAARSGAPAALQGASLVVERGEQVAVIGPSGAGKTTLLHVAAAALRPQAGQVMLNAQTPWSLGTRALRDLRAQLFLAP